MSVLDYYSKQELENIVKDSYSIKEVLSKLGYSTIGGNNHKTLKNRIEILEIDTSHFKGRRPVERNVGNVFVKNSTASQKTLRDWYEKGNYSQYVCSICGQEPIWNNKKLTLILDHINGINNDDRLENLRWVCPNCNQQLETTGHTKYHTRNNCDGRKRFCKCGVVISRNASKCIKCAGEDKRKTPNVEKEVLENMLLNKNFVEIAKVCKVSDNCIRKWCKKYDLPTNKQELERYRALAKR